MVDVDRPRLDDFMAKYMTEEKFMKLYDQTKDIHLPGSGNSYTVVHLIETNPIHSLIFEMSRYEAIEEIMLENFVQNQFYHDRERSYNYFWTSPRRQLDRLQIQQAVWTYMYLTGCDDVLDTFKLLSEMMFLKSVDCNQSVAELEVAVGNYTLSGDELQQLDSESCLSEQVK